MIPEIRHLKDHLRDLENALEGSPQPGVATPPQPIRDGQGASILGPTNPPREAQAPDLIAPPSTDHGTLPNLRWSFADSHIRLSDGGWARQTTVRELPIATEFAAVNMRLQAGAVRELHWHREAEWAYMIAGRARITAVDSELRAFQDDVSEGDIWYFPAGVAHSIQGLPNDGCEMLLVHDDGNFDANSTFNLTDWLARTPREVLAKNFDVPESAFANIPDHELYIFHAPVPGPLSAERIVGAGPVPEPFTHHLLAQEPVRTKGGSFRIVDSRVFKASKTISAAMIEIEPGGLRELHWHPLGDEWLYFLSGEARMGVYGTNGNTGTFDYQAGDVGLVPHPMGHYVVNRGTTTLRFLGLFRGDHVEEAALSKMLALTPHELVRAHLHIDQSILAKIPVRHTPVVPI
jgi:oxalate decarboxylase